MAKKRVTDELQMINSFFNSFDVSNYLVGKKKYAMQRGVDLLVHYV